MRQTMKYVIVLACCCMFNLQVGLGQEAPPAAEAPDAPPCDLPVVDEAAPPAEAFPWGNAPMRGRRGGMGMGMMQGRGMMMGGGMGMGPGMGGMMMGQPAPQAVTDDQPIQRRQRKQLREQRGDNGERPFRGKANRGNRPGRGQGNLERGPQAEKPCCPNCGCPLAQKGRKGPQRFGDGMPGMRGPRGAMADRPRMKQMRQHRRMMMRNNEDCPMNDGFGPGPMMQGRRQGPMGQGFADRPMRGGFGRGPMMQGRRQGPMGQGFADRPMRGGFGRGPMMQGDRPGRGMMMRRQMQDGPGQGLDDVLPMQVRQRIANMVRMAYAMGYRQSMMDDDAPKEQGPQQGAPGPRRGMRRGGGAGFGFGPGPAGPGRRGGFRGPAGDVDDGPGFGPMDM